MLIALTAGIAGHRQLRQHYLVFVKYTMWSWHKQSDCRLNSWPPGSKKVRNSKKTHIHDQARGRPLAQTWDACLALRGRSFADSGGNYAHRLYTLKTCRLCGKTDGQTRAWPDNRQAVETWRANKTLRAGV